MPPLKASPIHPVSIAQGVANSPYNSRKITANMEATAATTVLRARSFVKSIVMIFVNTAFCHPL